MKRIDFNDLGPIKTSAGTTFPDLAPIQSHDPAQPLHPRRQLHRARAHDGSGERDLHLAAPHEPTWRMTCATLMN